MKAMRVAALDFYPALAAAVDRVPLSGDQVRAAVTGHKLQYNNGWRDSRASGRTLCNAGADSRGYWRVQGDQYRSQWPPFDLWACYDLARSGNKLRFITRGNDISEAVYAD